jgi:hypothetical protein
MGSDAAGCNVFRAIRQGQLTNNLGVAALICLKNKALRGSATHATAMSADTTPFSATIKESAISF